FGLTGTLVHLFPQPHGTRFGGAKGNRRQPREQAHQTSAPKHQSRQRYSHRNTFIPRLRFRCSATAHSSSAISCFPTVVISRNRKRREPGTNDPRWSCKGGNDNLSGKVPCLGLHHLARCFASEAA